jgi:hypothetical protein
LVTAGGGGFVAIASNAGLGGLRDGVSLSVMTIMAADSTSAQTAARHRLTVTRPCGYPGSKRGEWLPGRRTSVVSNSMDAPSRVNKAGLSSPRMR